MKELTNITLYKCDHCGKKYQVKRAAEYHESVCSKNPDNHRSCFGCQYLCKKQTTLYEDHPMGGELKRDVELLYCEKIESFLYPPKVEKKGNQCDTGDDLNQPMRRECEHWKLKLPF